VFNAFLFSRTRQVDLYHDMKRIAESGIENMSMKDIEATIRNCTERLAHQLQCPMCHTIFNRIHQGETFLARCGHLFCIANGCVDRAGGMSRINCPQCVRR
jgi:hypothetical protein